MANEPRGILVPLVYSEVLDGEPTRANLEAAIGKAFWQSIAMQIVGILCVSWQDGVENVDHQRPLIVEMLRNLPYRKKIAKILQDEPHRRVFTREGLVAVLRMAVAEGSAGDGTDEEHANAFVTASLIANELLAAEITPEVITNGPADFLPTELRSAILSLENPHDLLGRTDAFFAWSRTDKARASANYTDITADLFRFTGLTPMEFMAGAYFAFARYSSMVNFQEVQRLGVAFSIAQWQAGMADTRVVRQWIAMNAIPLATVRAEWKAEPSMSFAAAGSIWRKPIVQVEDDLFFAPVPALVGNAMGDGAYFVLFDGYRDEAGPDPDARKRAVAKFTGFYGEFFEDHVASIFEKAYDGKPNRRFTRELPYSEGAMSTDVIMAEGSDVIFVEIVSKRMNLRASVLHLKPSAIAKDIEDGVMHKARQINENIDKFRKGELLPDWPRPEGQRFYPIIVAPSDRPRITVITTDLAQAQRNGLLAGAEPLELLDLGEVEQMENGLVAGVSLVKLLDNKNRSTPEHRLMSVHNYLYYVEHNLLPAGMSPTRQQGSDVARAIIALANTWERGPEPRA